MDNSRIQQHLSFGKVITDFQKENGLNSFEIVSLLKSQRDSKIYDIEHQKNEHEDALAFYDANKFMLD